MKFFSRWFKKKEKIIEEPNTEVINPKAYVVDLCEQMIHMCKELEDAKDEYNLLSSYLGDIQILEELPKEQRAQINEAASNVSKLNLAREAFMNAEKKISDAQYMQMQEEDDEMPRIIKRFQENEADLDRINRDLKRLDGQKITCQVERIEYLNEQKTLRKFGIAVCFLFAIAMVIFLFAALVAKMNTLFPLTVAAFLATLGGAYILLRYQDCSKEIRKCELARNRAITLENKVKIKYVNVKNAVDYSCTKYHVKNAYELIYVYEQYQERVREREKFRQNSDDLEFYQGQLIRFLNKSSLYDTKVWIHHANALVDANEMEELKNDLVARRQKLRGRMEYSQNVVLDMKKEVEGYLNRLETEDKQQIQLILHKLDKTCLVGV